MSSRILKPCEESCGASSSKRSRRIMKKPLIGSVSVTPSRRARERGRQLARLLAAARCERPAAEPPRHVAARDRKIDAAAQLLQHRGEQRLVVLQVGVHHGDVCAPGSPACPRCRRPTSPRRPMRRTQRTRASRLADLARDRRGAVGRIVVDEHDLPVDAGERARELFHQQRNVVAFLEGRNHDAQFRRRRVCAGQARARALGRRCFIAAVIGERAHVQCEWPLLDAPSPQSRMP